MMTLNQASKTNDNFSCIAVHLQPIFQISMKYYRFRTEIAEITYLEPDELRIVNVLFGFIT